MAQYTDSIQTNMEQASASLADAASLLQAGRFDEAVARAAVSARYSCVALLLDEDVEPEKHGDVITIIQRVFVNGRRLTEEQGQKLSWLFQTGSPPDSEERVPLLPAEAQKAVEFAQSFFEAAQVILEG